jgi:hypothetical protein
MCLLLQRRPGRVEVSNSNGAQRPGQSQLWMRLEVSILRRHPDALESGWRLGGLGGLLKSSVAAAVAVAAGGKHCTPTSGVFIEHYTINRVIKILIFSLYVFGEPAVYFS